MSTKFRLLQTAVVLVLVAFSAAAYSEDAFFELQIDALKFTEGALPPRKAVTNWRLWQRAADMAPYAVLDGPGEAYAKLGEGARRPWSPPNAQAERGMLLIRVPERRDVTGRLFYPDSDWSGMTTLRFTVPAAAARDDARKPFYVAKKEHYHALMARAIPGAAWFRYEARQAEHALGEQPAATPPQQPWQRGRFGQNALEDTYDLFTGGRAVSENLQLDRLLRETKHEEATVDVDKLEGITIEQIDWQPLIKDLKPELDPLAAAIPADQHVIFFPTFAAAVRTADEAQRQGTPILYLAEPRSEDAMTSQRYERQLGLKMSTLGRLLGPHVVQSMALTGSDPYFRTGTDVAVVFESKNAGLLENLLLTRIMMAAAQETGAKAEQGEVAGLHYQGIRSPDRTISSYVARLNGAVVVTNSLYQLQRLANVQKKEAPSIASLSEYVFFRNRYRRGEADEAALVFLSDTAIRRWCGPRWRIASSRQTRDMAVLADLTAANIDPLVKKTVQPGPIYTDFTLAEPGQLRLDLSGVHSSVEGSLEFMTPIAEIPLDKVTQAEADAYRGWRDNYQRNWQWAFDPIALRLTFEHDRLAADLSVMPLIWASEYREMVTISRGASFDPQSGDLHDALAHFILAINKQSPTFAMGENFISAMSHGVTLGWLGSSVALYVDDDPLWQELAKVPHDKLDKFFESRLGGIPIAVRFDVSNGLRLTAFLAAFRAYVEQTAPGMAEWQSLSYKDQPYVKIVPSERAKGRDKHLQNLAFYYAASGDALVVTLSENVLKRAIDRQLARAAAAKGDNPARPAEAEKPWLGSNVALQADEKALAILSRLCQDQYQLAMQLRAWSNLPILNEWKRRYPDQDPVAVHQRVWKIRLLCPGGGNYVWNEAYHTMESTVYGHPGQPKAGPVAPPALTEFARGSFGLTFEEQGLRARVSLQRAAAK